MILLIWFNLRWANNQNYRKSFVSWIAPTRQLKIRVVAISKNIFCSPMWLRISLCLLRMHSTGLTETCNLVAIAASLIILRILRWRRESKVDTTSTPMTNSEVASLIQIKLMRHKPKLIKDCLRFNPFRIQSHSSGRKNSRHTKWDHHYQVSSSK